MRKLLLLVISVCYLASTSVVAMQWHYCMGKLSNVALSLGQESHTCGTCGMELGANHCCKDEISITKVSDSHQQPSTIAAAFVPVAPLAQTIGQPDPNILLLSATYVFATSFHPPGLVKDRSILFCVFRC